MLQSRVGVIIQSLLWAGSTELQFPIFRKRTLAALQKIGKEGSNQPFAALLRNGYFGAKAKLCKARSLSIAVVGPKRSIRHFGFKHAFRPSPKHIP